MWALWFRAPSQATPLDHLEIAEASLAGAHLRLLRCKRPAGRQNRIGRQRSRFSRDLPWKCGHTDCRMLQLTGRNLQDLQSCLPTLYRLPHPAVVIGHVGEYGSYTTTALRNGNRRCFCRGCLSLSSILCVQTTNYWNDCRILLCYNMEEDAVVRVRHASTSIPSALHGWVAGALSAVP